MQTNAVLKCGIQPLLQQVQPDDGALPDRHKGSNGVRDPDQNYEW